MNINIVTLAILILSCSLIISSITGLIKRRVGYTLFKTALTIFIWGGVSLILIFPNLSTYISKYTGLEGNVNSLVAFGFIILFFLVFKIIAMMTEQNITITKLVRQIALSDIKNTTK